MCSVNCPFNDLGNKKYIESIAKNVFNREIEIYKKDIYSSFKYYMIYDPKFITFRNLSIDHYNKTLDKETCFQLKKASDSINDIMNNKISQIKKEPPVDILIKSTLKEIEPVVTQTNNYAKAGLMLGFVNFIGLALLYNS
jgi:hypothetical protein